MEIEQAKTQDAIDNYAEELAKLYGGADKFHAPHQIWLFIADTHGVINFSLDEFVDYNAVILLGDHDLRDLNTIMLNLPREYDGKPLPVYGLAGNHNTYKLYDIWNDDPFAKTYGYHIEHLTNGIHNICGVKCACFNGSFRYKNNGRCMYTQEEIQNIAKNMDVADIVLSHSGPYITKTNNAVHEGLKGITEYAIRQHIPYLFHGHLHQDKTYNLANGTECVNIYGAKLIHF